MADEIKDLQKGITEILVAIGKIETEIKQFSNVVKKVDDTEKLAIEALQSTKAAHKRLDDMSKELTELNKKADEIKKEIEKKIEDDKKQSKDDKKWVLGTVLGAIALVWKFIESVSKGGGAQ